MKHTGTMLPRVGLAFALTWALAAVACEGMLDVSDPSRYLDEALDDPRAFPSLANGVEGRLHQQVPNLVIYTGLLSDEFMHTGTWTEYEDGDKGRLRQGDNLSASEATDLTLVRTEAQQAEERFVRVLGEDAYNEDFTARVKVIEGWANLLLAQATCEAVLEANGPAVADTAVYQAAIATLTRGLEIATQSNATDFVHLARAGRARANLMIGNYDAAYADAQTVPDDFLYTAKFSEQGTANSLVTLNHYTENKAAGLDSRRWSQVDTTAGFLIDTWSGELDQRVKIVHRVGNRLGVDGRTLFYSHDKYTVRASPIPMTHGREMRLIEAEVHWRKGELDQAVAKMNVVRATVSLPPLTNPATSEGVFEMLLEERFVTLFLEGQRANDLYRFGLFPTVIGTGYNTKFQLPSVEVRNNPSTPLPRPCPRVS